MAEDYWAPITTLVVMQSTFGAAWTTAKQRLFGTALGVSVGALLASGFGPSIAAFGAAIFALGPICTVLRLDRSGYRFAGIALAIVLLIARVQSPWVTGFHRFVEVSIGIVVALAVTAAWPQSDLPAGSAARTVP